LFGSKEAMTMTRPSRTRNRIDQLSHGMNLGGGPEPELVHSNPSGKGTV